MTMKPSYMAASNATLMLILYSSTTPLETPFQHPHPPFTQSSSSPLFANAYVVGGGGSSSSVKDHTKQVPITSNNNNDCTTKIDINSHEPSSQVFSSGPAVAVVGDDDERPHLSPQDKVSSSYDDDMMESWYVENDFYDDKMITALHEQVRTCGSLLSSSPSLHSILIAADSKVSSPVLSPIEAWCLTRLDTWYSRSQSTKCPFLRRRSGDILDTVETLLNMFVIRPECQQTPQAHRPAGTNKKSNTIKYKHLPPQQLQQYVLQDWKKGETGNKGYYVTGKLTTAVYRDDCLFLGPDPDMPIHGTRKYVGVASHLFDYTASEAVLHTLKVVRLQDLPTARLRPERKQDIKLRRQLKNCSSGDNSNEFCLVADWTISGILRLPWHPSLPTFSGQTIYHVDNDGLIVCHEESWDCSALQAFCYTLFPELADRIWQHEQQQQKHNDDRQKN
jgi:Uncharacterized conserved protein (DUF2358)